MLATLDPAFFIDGLHDILRHRPDQHIANDLAAFCAISMAPGGPAAGHGAREAARRRLHHCLGWILERHLHELHPLIWSQALLCPGQTTPLPSRRAFIDRGHDAALQVIARHYSEEIAGGKRIAFSPGGMYQLGTS
jgi:hypothetical protein